MFLELFTNSGELTEKSTQSNMKIEQLMQYAYIPISGPMLDRLGFLEEDFEAFHATTLDHLKGLQKLGKSKKGISTFTYGLDSIVRNIVVMPEVLAKVKGTRLLGATADFYTYLDKQGRRWFKVKGKDAKFVRESLLVPTINFMSDLAAKILEPDEIDMMVASEDFDFINMIDSLSKRDKGKVIKFYMDNAERVMNSPATFKIISKHLKASSDLSHDEVVVNNFKVTRVYSLEANKYAHNRETAENDVESLGFEYWGHIPKSLFKSVTPDNY